MANIARHRDDVRGWGHRARPGSKHTKPVKNIVLVHGGFVDGSGWESVYNILTKKGYHVAVVQNPTITS